MSKTRWVRCWLAMLGEVHPAHTNWPDEAMCPGIRPLPPKVKVAWEEAPKGVFHPVMWVGRCTACDYTTQYWAWGATMGRMLEHQWKGCKSDGRA